jgi:hypothetical protein
MFCRKCGVDMPEDSQFCLKCGVSVVVPSVISISPSGTATGVAPALEPNAAAKTSGQPIGTLSSPSTPRTTGNPPTGDPSNGLRLAADKSSLTEPARTALLEHEIQGRAIESNPLPIEQTELAVEPKPNKARASRWARLGIFLCVALASAIIAAVVFVKGDSTSVADLTEKLTSVSLKLGLAAWAVSEVVAGRWLTLKRTWIAAITLYSIAFVLTAVFLGKPLVTKLAEVNEEQTQRFAESATGKTLLQPQSAEQRLTAFEKHFDAENDRLDKEMGAVTLGDDVFKSRLPSVEEAEMMHQALTNYCEGTRTLINEQAAFLASEHITLAPVAVSQHRAALNSCDAGIALWAFLATPATPSERSHLGPWRDNYAEKLTAYRDAANAQKKVDADFDAYKAKGNR